LWVCVFFRELSLCDQVDVLLFVDECVSERIFFIRNLMCAAGGWVGACK